MSSHKSHSPSQFSLLSPLGRPNNCPVLVPVLHLLPLSPFPPPLFIWAPCSTSPKQHCLFASMVLSFSQRVARGAALTRLFGSPPLRFIGMTATRKEGEKSNRTPLVINWRCNYIIMKGGLFFCVAGRWYGAGKWLFIMLTLCCLNTFIPIRLVLNDTIRFVLCIKRSTALGEVCAAIISAGDLAFVLKVS